MDEIEDFSEKISEADLNDPQIQIPAELPVLPLRDIVIYPFMIGLLRKSQEWVAPIVMDKFLSRH